MLTGIWREKGAMSKIVQESERETRQASQALERYLERLLQDRCPHRPHQLTPDQVGVYQMAALYRVVSPGAPTPEPGFAARLQEQVTAAFGYRPCRDKEWAEHDSIQKS
jgi:hypothetical protein